MCSCVITRGMDMVRRLFIFAAWDRDNIVDGACLFYLRELSKCGDIIFVADNDLTSDELDGVLSVPNLLYADAVRHGEYDFGSYKRGFAWARDAKILGKYDWVYFVNDSVYGPIGDLGDVLVQLEGAGHEFVGMVTNSDKNIPPHVQSWFMGIGRNIVDAVYVHSFFDGIKKLENKSQICIQYEVGFSELMKSHGVDFVTRFVQFNHRSNVVYRRPYRALRRGVPFIKKSGLKNMFGFDFVARYVKNPKLMNAIRENALRYNVQFRCQGWIRRIFK